MEVEARRLGGGKGDREAVAVDVLVVGGGPAGMGAALAACRAGAKTLLLERYGFLGGIASSSMGMPMNQMLPGGRSRGAIHDLVIQGVRAYGDEAARVVGHALVCNVEYLKVALMAVLDSSGCGYQLHSRVVDALREGDRVAGAVLATKQGYLEVRAKAVVDASGDADVAYYAGVETATGREADGFLSPMTLCLILTNVNVAQARSFAHEGGLARIAEQGKEKYPLLPEAMHFELGPFPQDNALVMNHSGTKGLGPLDGTDPVYLTKAERFSRRQALQIVQALREWGGPAFRHAQLAATGPQVGVRETRRIRGVYSLTEEDAKTGRRFDDAIAWRSGYLDIGFVRFEPMQVHDVPYRSLLPEKLEGLLVAGRCISATHVAASAGKSMGNCMATGHAAGLAAALAARKGIQPRELKVTELQDALRADGVDLERV